MFVDYPGGFGELVLFDTLLPQDHPRNLRRARPPLIYRGWVPYANTIHDAPWGALNRHAPLTVDPTQAIHVVTFLHGDKNRHVILAFRKQALIEQVCSLDTDADIPWDEWGRDSMILEIPISDNPRTLVQELHVIKVKMCGVRVPGGYKRQLRLRTFDFSLRACGALSDVGEGGEYLRAFRNEDGRDVFLEGSENLSEHGFGSLGNGIFFHPVSCFCNWGTRLG